jgi:hypothetical protein
MVADLESKRLNKAKEVLLDSEKRSEYDDLLGRDVQGKEGTGSSDLSLEDIEGRTEEEYKAELSALQTMIVGLNAENSNLRTELRNEKKYRTNLEDQFTLLASDRFWMKRDLEMIINRFDEQIRIMDEAYRTAINQLINNLFIEIQFSEDEFVETQNRIMQIQNHNMRLLSDTLIRFNYFNEVRERLASMKESRNVSHQPDVDLNAQSDFEPIEVNENNMPDIDWDYGAEAKSKPAKKVKKKKRKKGDFIDVQYSSVDAGSAEIASNRKNGPAGLSQCPFCSKDVSKDQTYCYYCGAVF